MQPLALEPESGRQHRVGSVGQVTAAWVVQRGKVHANLVRPSRFEVDVEERRRGEHLERVVVGDARLAVRGDRELPVGSPMTSDRRVDGPGRRIEVTLHQRVVPLVDLTVAERALEQRVSVLRRRDNHQPRRSDVEARHDALPFGRAGGRDPETRGVQRADDGWPAPPQRRMGSHADGLVDDDDVGVVVDHRQVFDRCRLYSQRLVRLGKQHVEPTSGRELVRLADCDAVDGHIARVGEIGHDGPRQAEDAGHPGIEAHARDPVGNRHGTRFTHSRPRPSRRAERRSRSASRRSRIRAATARRAARHRRQPRNRRR
ncbi:Uncharacterised protein [Mycobacteroides abscessus subsp. abscessus]|nr:Uncharacterised protein [Mycobacteroides abscessus subsp. abscessus]